MRAPKAILFDLDDTILPSIGRPDLAWRRAVDENFADSASARAAAESAALLADAILAYSREFWSDPDRHRRWRLDMQSARRQIVAEACARLGQHGFGMLESSQARRIADRFTAFCEAEISIVPDAHETLGALRRRGLRLALVTNGATAAQREKIERFALAPFFDHIQIEEEAGVGKPEAAAYRHALQALDTAPHETWMVGDNLEWEVAAPQRLGIVGVWCDHRGRGLPKGGDVRPDLIIRALSELLGHHEATGQDPLQAGRDRLNRSRETI
jgi:putative hydrolase of the HAD superfamily